MNQSDIDHELDRNLFNHLDIDFAEWDEDEDDIYGDLDAEIARSQRKRDTEQQRYDIMLAIFAHGTDDEDDEDE